MADLTRAVDAGAEETGITAVEHVAGQQRVVELALDAFDIEAIVIGAGPFISEIRNIHPAA